MHHHCPPNLTSQSPPTKGEAWWQTIWSSISIAIPFTSFTPSRLLHGTSDISTWGAQLEPSVLLPVPSTICVTLCYRIVALSFDSCWRSGRSLTHSVASSSPGSQGCVPRSHLVLDTSLRAIIKHRLYLPHKTCTKYVYPRGHGYSQCGG